MPLGPDAAIVAMRLMGGALAADAFSSVESSAEDDTAVAKILRNIVGQDAGLEWYKSLSIDRRLRAWDFELEPLFQGHPRQDWFHVLREHLREAVIGGFPGSIRCTDTGAPWELDPYLGPLASYRVGLSVLRIASPYQDEIAGCAFEQWEKKGRRHGHDLDDWLRAEHEVGNRRDYRDLHAHLGASVPFDDYWGYWLEGKRTDASRALIREESRELYKAVDEAKGLLSQLGVEDGAGACRDHQALALIGCSLPLHQRSRLRRYIQLRVSALRALQFQRGDGQLDEFVDRCGIWPSPLGLLPKRRWEAVNAAEAAYRCGCRYVEYRLMLPRRPMDLIFLPALLGVLSAVGLSMKKQRGLDVRWVLAHRRDQDGKSNEACARAMISTRKLLELLDDDKNEQLRDDVCGVDIVGKERATSLAVFRDAYRLIDDYNDENRRRGRPLLGKCVHAGEDFYSPSSGLRSVDEALGIPGIDGTGLGLRPGDRLGHCTALGLNPASLIGRIFEVPVLTRLRDLAWMRHLDAQKLARLPHPESIDREIRELFVGSLVSGPSVHAMAHCLLSAADVPFDLASDRRVCCRVGPLEALQISRLQRYLMHRIRSRRLIIESCPTSNLVIQGLQDYRAVPFWRLNHARLQCTINTDDAGVLGTTLHHEVQALIRAAQTGVERDAVKAAISRASAFAFRQK